MAKEWGIPETGAPPGHSEPAPTTAPSTGCLLLLCCGGTLTELIFGFTLVTNYVGDRSCT
jgi:hypothetical protein